MMLSQRLDLSKTDPAAYQPMYAMEKYIHSGTLGEGLLALVKIRASQLNGCAYCLAMHHGEARSAGVPQRKTDVLAAWHEAPTLYDARERAALALTEQVTRIGDEGVSDDVWADVRSSFSDKEVAELMMAICAINVWNRLAVTTHQDLPPERTA